MALAVKVSRGGGGGSTLYLHKVKIKTGSSDTGYEIINDSATQFTKTTFRQHYRDIGANTMLFHHAEVNGSALSIYIINCANTSDAVKVYKSDGSSSVTGIQEFTDTVTAL